MSREVQVRFCERRGVRCPPPTLHLLGFTGPKAEAEVIKQRLAGFLRDELKLELSYHKTLITHACTGAAGFLGYEITVQHYLLAGNVHRLHRLRWVMETSMLKTLAGKHRSSTSKTAAKHKAKIQT